MHSAKLFLEYHGIVKINQLYYFLKRLPLLGKKLPLAPRVGVKGKKTLITLGIIYRILNCIFNSAILMAFCYLPWKFNVFSFIGVAPKDPATGFLQSFFFMSILAGPLIFRQGRQELDWTGYYFLKVFRFPERSFFLNRIFLNLARIALGLLPPMLFMAWLIGDFPRVLMAYLASLFMRLFIEAFTLYLFEKKGKTLWEAAWFYVVSVLSFLILAFVPFLGHVGKWLPLIALPMTFLGALWGLFYLKRAAYDKLASGLTTTEELTASKNSKDSAEFMAVKLEEEDITREQPKDVDKKQGYDYLHSLIFYRIKNKLDRTTKRTVKIISVLGLLLFIAGLNFRESMAVESEQLLYITLRVSFFYSYLLSPGERFTKLLFLYMDKDLLPFHYYREPKAILRSLKIRLFKLLEITAPITGIVLLSLLAFFGLFYQELGLKILLLIPVLLVQGAFFALYRLMVYYLLQPYTAKMEAKSPSATIANGVVYLISFAFLQIKEIGPMAVAVLCGVMGIIALIAPFVLKAKGPKTFKLREG